MPRYCLRFLAPVYLSLWLAVHAAQPIELATGVPPNHPQQPQVAIDRAGGIHIVFGVGDQIRYCRSTDGGRTFSPPSDLPLVHSMSLGMRRGPRIAVGEHFVCVTAIGSKFKGGDGDLVAFRSADDGRSWQGPVIVNDQPAAAAEGLQAMAAGPAGELACVWLDFRGNGPKTVTASLSTDGGATWTKNKVVYQSPDGPVCPCCHPSVAFDRLGNLYVMWRNALAGNRDMYVSVSTDGGHSFATATKLGEGAWPLKTCPMDGGALALLAPGQLATAWRREKQIFLTLPGQSKERLLGSGEQPWLAATPSGPLVAWVTKRGEDLLLLRPGDHKPIVLAAHASDPVLATAPGGGTAAPAPRGAAGATAPGGGPIVIAWENRDNGRYSIHCQILSVP